jgi:hypothetical protein
VEPARASRRIRLIWADAVYTGQPERLGRQHEDDLQIVARRHPHAFEVLPRRWWWKARSPGSATIAAPSAITDASRPATKP